MTVSSSVRKAGPFAGNNIATTFPFSFKVFTKSDLKALLVNSSGVSTPLTLDSDYSVQLNANQNSSPGGWITYPISGNPLAIGNEIVMLGDLTYDQETDITNAGGFYPSVIEDMSDRSTIQIQQLAEITSRALVVTEAETTSPTLPNAQARANSVLGFDASGNIELFGLTPAVGAGDLKNESWSAGVDYVAGTSTSVGLSRAYGTKANLGTVVMAGIAQDPASYSLTNNGLTLQFDSVIPSAVTRIWCVGGTTLSIYVPPDGSVSNSKLAPGAVTDDKVTSVTAAKIQYQLPGAGTVLRDVYGTLLQGVSLFDFIPLNLQSSVLNGSITGQDLSVYMQAARDWCAAKSVKPRLLVPPGFYPYTTSPNWAIQNLSIVGLGECHFQYGGTGVAVILDGTGAPNLGVYDVTMRGITIDSNAAALDGALVSYCHHSDIKFKVRGAGAAYAGVKTSFCVASEFELEVSPNADGGWLGGAKPLYGVHVTGPSALLQTSYSTFRNTICEGLTATNGAGIFINASLGNQFYGGTSEGSATGILTANTASGCVNNKFFGMDMEANVTQDIYDQGFQNEYHSCDTNLLVNIIGNAIRTQVFGGQHQNISIAAGASYPGFFGVVYNRNGGGAFTDGSGTARIRDCFDHFNYKPGPFTQTVLAPTTGVWTYTNSSGRFAMLTVSSGTISQVQLLRSGTGTLLAQTSGTFMLAPGDALQITSSVAPSASVFTM